MWESETKIEKERERDEQKGYGKQKYFFTDFF